MSGRHTGAHRSPLVSVVAAVLLIGAVVTTLVLQHRDTTTDGEGAGYLPHAAATPTSATPTSSATLTPTRSAASSTVRAAPLSTAARHAVTYPAVSRLIAEAPSGGASVSAYNTVTGKTITLGATHGMIEASVSKVALLEILLLEHEDAHTTLSSYDKDELEDMIEDSSNDAADEVFELAGGHSTVVAEQRLIGLDTSITIYGSGNLWGLTTSSAAQQVVLLKNLVNATSPLDASYRGYALNLLEHVDSDQAWGAPVAADPGTTYAVKNGWLAVDADDDLWAVNSDGIVTVDGQRLLISVMTQHGSSYAEGIAYVEKLVKAVAASLT